MSKREKSEKYPESRKRDPFAIMEKKKSNSLCYSKYSIFFRNNVLKTLWRVFFGIRNSDNKFNRILKTLFVSVILCVWFLYLFVLALDTINRFYIRTYVASGIFSIHVFFYVCYVFAGKLWIMSTSVSIQFLIAAASLPFCMEFKGIRNTFSPNLLAAIPLVNIIVTNNSGFHLFSIIGVIVVDIVVTSFEFVFFFDLEPTNSQIIITWISSLVAVQFIVFSVSLILKRVVTKERKMLVKLTELIGNLDFENEFVGKILKKKDSQLSVVLINFKKILNHMKNYKSYLPCSLYVRKDEIQLSRRGSVCSLGSSNELTDNSLDNSSQSRSFENSNESKKTDGIFGKKVVLMICQIEIEQVTKMGELHIEVTKKIENTAKKFKGNIHHFNGFNFLIGFDILLNVDSPEKQACLCAIECKKLIQNCSVVVTSGNVFYGNMGSDSNKRFCIFGDLYEKCSLLSSNQKKEINFPIIIDEKVFKKVKFSMKAIPIYVCSIEKAESASDLFIIYSLLSERVKEKCFNNDQEWNYEISSYLSENHDENDSWVDYKNGNFDSVKYPSVLKLVEDHPGQVKYFNLLKRTEEFKYVNEL